jgi:putative membrane protein
MNHKHLSAALVAGSCMFFLMSGPVVAQNTRADTEFVREAAIGGMTEVELGRLAVQKSSNDKVKEFGQKMIDDHSKANDKLKSIAAKDSITIPSDLDVKHRATVNRFSKMSGTEFDRVYARDMVADHEADVASFEKEAAKGSNPDLKSFASETLPTLREHLRIAKDNETTLGSTSSTRK